MERPRCIVLDFDGTFTEVDEEAIPFLECYRRGLSDVFKGDLEAAWAEAERTIYADPNAFGWEYDGKIVAPSHSDPYILATTVGQILLRQQGDMEEEAISSTLEQLYQRCYPEAGKVFRSDAKAVVETLLATDIPVFVVTNSMTHHVQEKLDALAPEGLERLRVLGDAKKYVIHESTAGDARFENLPEHLSLAGLHRPILLRRGHYFDTLSTLWAETGATPEQTLVCGDIYELDLALPAALGAQVHLVARPATPAYERAALEKSGGTLSTELGGLLELLDRA